MNIRSDIQPENVLISSKGVVKIADFDLSCEHSASTASGVHTRVGSDWYFSPEKANGDAYDGRDDVWAAGCILLELSSGKRNGRPLCSSSEETRVHREQLIVAVGRVSCALQNVAREMLIPDKRERAEAVNVLAALHAALKQVLARGAFSGSSCCVLPCV
jgi:serine/threonine protein kinase